MAKAKLRLVAPSTVNRTVTARRFLAPRPSGAFFLHCVPHHAEFSKAVGTCIKAARSSCVVEREGSVAK